MMERRTGSSSATHDLETSTEVADSQLVAEKDIMQAVFGPDFVYVPRGWMRRGASEEDEANGSSQVHRGKGPPDSKGAHAHGGVSSCEEGTGDRENSLVTAETQLTTILDKLDSVVSYQMVLVRGLFQA